MRKNQGVLLLIIFSLLTGFGVYFVKRTSGISPVQILFFRAVLASVLLFIVAIVTNSFKDLKFRFPLNTVIMGLTQGWSIFLFYAALSKTTITNAILLSYTAPVFSAILSVIFLKEKIEKKTIFGIILSFLGVLIISNPQEFRMDSSQTIGSLLAILAGFFYGAMAISSKSLTEKTKPIYSAFWQYFIIMIMTSFVLFKLPVEAFTNNIIPLIYLGWAAGGIAFLIYMKGISLVKGQNIQVITMTEVVVASLSGILLLKEPLTLTVILGGLLILTGVLIVSVSKAKMKHSISSERRTLDATG